MNTPLRLTTLIALTMFATGITACGKGGSSSPPDGSAGAAGSAGGSSGDTGSAGASGGSAGAAAGSAGSFAGSAGSSAGSSGSSGSDAGAAVDAAGDASAASCLLIANGTYYATSGTISGMADGVAFTFTNVTESLIGTNGGFAASASPGVPRILFDLYYRSAAPGTYTCAMQNIGVSWSDGTNSFEARLQRPPSVCEIKLTESGPMGGHVRGTFTATMISGAKQLTLTGGSFDFIRCTM